MFQGRYYDGHTSLATPVQCEVNADGTLAIRGDNVALQVPRELIEVTPRLARTFRTLRLTGGAQVHSEDNDGVDAAFPDRNTIESIADRLERYPYVVAVSVLVVIAVGFALFQIGLPWAAERVAQRIPPAVEKSMGDRALSTLRYYVLKTSGLPTDEERKLQASFADFVKDVPGAENYRVMFFKAPGIGANAFALPGGTIVVTDELMDMIADDDDKQDEFLAVAAHEVGHQQYRHVMRSVLQQSAVAIVTAYFAGDVGSASTVVVAIPTFLLQNHYSRDFETQADDYAFQALAAHGISPRAFANVMREFQKQDAGDDDDTDYTSTHPLTAERIARAEAAADAFEKNKR